MKVLITGAKGFVGRNLIAALNCIRDGKDKRFNMDTDITLFEYDIDTPEEMLDKFADECDFVFHLAGVNRPKDEKEFMEGNFGFSFVLLEKLKKNNNKAPILITSSIQAAFDNPYGKSKKAGEELIFNYGRENDVRVCVYRLPNVFGKWCRPNYNSAVATFCHNIAHNLPITVNDRSHLMTLVYIDDVVSEFIMALNQKENKNRDGYCYVPTVHEITLGEIVDLLYSYRRSRDDKQIPYLKENSFEKKLYSTYLSYLPEREFSYSLEMHCDERGSFTEMFRSPERGQVSVNISKPGITKGNHWHHTKNEKFVVVSGKGVIRFRKPESDKIIEYYVSGDKIEVVDIPVGYTHNIENLGDTDMVTVMWCNECFDPDKPDTYFLEV